MKLAIVAYPILDERDRAWIESFRLKHDPQAAQIDVHFTLVFPVEASPGELGPELVTVARSTQPISFAIRRTEVVRDALGSSSQIFLVADDGGAEITTLHGRLYTGVLRAHLRSDIPFVPHMTVGADGDARAAARLADELGVSSRIVRGTITSMDLIAVGHPRVQSIATYAFGNGAVTAG